MKEVYSLWLNKFPSNKTIAVLKIVRKFTSMGLKEAKDLIEAVPKVALQTYEREEAEAFKRELENAGAMVVLVTDKVDKVLPDENADFLEIVEYLKEKWFTTRLLEEEKSRKIREEDSKISKVKHNLEKLNPELEQLGKTICNNSINLSSSESQDYFKKIEETKVKLSEEKEARKQRAEESKKGFWNKIKSSVGNLLDNVENHEKDLQNSYINLAKTVINNQEEVKLLVSIAPDGLIENVQKNCATEATAKEEKARYQQEKSKVEADLRDLIKFGEAKVNSCSSLEEFEEVTSGLDNEVKEPLYKKAKNILPEKKYPYVRNTIGGAVALVDNYIVISKGGFFKFTNFFDDDTNVTKIPVESLTAVQYKESGIKDGFIEFLYLGYFPKHNQNKHSQENVITFRGKKLNEQFSCFKETVEKQMREMKGKGKQAQTTSVADELEKFAKLYQQGFITEEEFTAKKAQILGL